MGLKEVVFPFAYGRKYGLGSASFLALLVFGEIVGLAFIGFAVAGRTDVFLALAAPIAVAAEVVALATAGVVLWRARAWKKERMRRYTKEYGDRSAYAIAGARIRSRRKARS